MKRKFIVTLLSLGIVGLVSFFLSENYSAIEKPPTILEEFSYHNSHKSAPTVTSSASPTAEPNRSSKKSSSNIKLPNAIDTNPLSLTVLVNKSYNVPSDYVPSDLVEATIPFSFSYKDPKKQLRQVAAQAIEEMFHAASLDGINLVGVSGYRSYNYQNILYQNQINQIGEQAASMISAAPGKSEHQTGLAMDISCAEVQYELSDTFAETPQGIWVAENCHRFGFIIRYPADKVYLTGYAYEPWHIRYVGTKLATYLKENNMCLEEYYGSTSSTADATPSQSEDSKYFRVEN